MIQVSEYYLELVRTIFQKYYKKPLTQEQIEQLAENILAFSKVIMEFYLKKQELYGDKYEIG
ncbi:hypothetical protein IPJ91_00500 [bacterium]|nr:MAG: hypothetical protein IPJ91_00500 [bacterium]